VNLLGLILLSLGLGLAAWLAFYWSVKSGQYDDPEGPKYRMLEDEDEAPPPPASGSDGLPRTPPREPPASTPKP